VRQDLARHMPLAGERAGARVPGRERDAEAEGRMGRTPRRAITPAHLGRVLGQVVALLALLLVGVALLIIVTLLTGR
jgi:hypothetical protein